MIADTPRARSRSLDAFRGITVAGMILVNDPLNGSLAFALTNILFWWVVMEVMYRKQVFIKIWSSAIRPLSRQGSDGCGRP